VRLHAAPTGLLVALQPMLASNSLIPFRWVAAFTVDEL